MCVNSRIKPSFRWVRPKCGKKNQRFTHPSTLFSIGHARLFHQIPTFPQFKIHSLQVATIAARLRGHLQVVVSGAHHAVGLNYDTLCCWCAPDTTLGLPRVILPTKNKPEQQTLGSYCRNYFMLWLYCPICAICADVWRCFMSQSPIWESRTAVHAIQFSIREKEANYQLVPRLAVGGKCR